MNKEKFVVIRTRPFGIRKVYYCSKQIDYKKQEVTYYLSPKNVDSKWWSSLKTKLYIKFVLGFQQWQYKRNKKAIQLKKCQDFAAFTRDVMPQIQAIDDLETRQKLIDDLILNFEKTFKDTTNPPFDILKQTLENRHAVR